MCGRIKGYQYRFPDGFYGTNIDSCYVNGISITYVSSPRKHIWTYAGGLTSDNVPYPFYCCPCNSDNTVAPGYKPNPNQVYPDEDTSLDIIELYI